MSKRRISRICFFFFQAEDGIRDVAVTGVQTCALPICGASGAGGDVDVLSRRYRQVAGGHGECGGGQIGRASCRGRGEISGVAVSLKKKKKNWDLTSSRERHSAPDTRKRTHLASSGRYT